MSPSIAAADASPHCTSHFLPIALSLAGLIDLYHHLLVARGNFATSGTRLADAAGEAHASLGPLCATLKLALTSLPLVDSHTEDVPTDSSPSLPGLQADLSCILTDYLAPAAVALRDTAEITLGGGNEDFASTVASSIDCTILDSLRPAICALAATLDRYRAILA